MTQNKIDLLGVKIDALSSHDLLESVVGYAEDGKQHTVMYVNADCMLIAQQNEPYRQILNSADIVYADGIGVVLGARLWGNRLDGRMTGADFMPRFCSQFASHGLGLYLLGARPGVADEAAKRLIEQVPGLEIVGTRHGYFGAEETRQVVKEINDCKPHILLVGLGVPTQERWIHDLRGELQVPVVWGVGGLFDFLSGRTRRGPQWLLDHGFEWLCRLVVEPRRLGRRYLIGIPQFLLRLLWCRLTSSAGHEL